MENNYGFLSTRFYRLMEWIWRFAYLNILWLTFTVLGLGVFGLFPATASAYSVIRKWLIKDPDTPMFSVFWSNYKAAFFGANGLGYCLIVMGYILYFNYNYLAVISGLEHTVILFFWYVTVTIYILLVLFLFPVYVHYQLKFFQYFKVAVLIAVANPLALVSMALALIIGSYLFRFIPGLIPFFSVSVLLWLIMWNAVHAFERIVRKKQRLANNEDSLIFRTRQLKEKISSATRSVND
ncbi:YesL family protein [Amphibacillus cookii]|uniref:YesL family protein n=1 Tax=Amphibacillus cookii TaxID=767787 RepID=UPI001959C0D9|nr:YesL family protein [Amphibacillus cookii]MBM7542621.1 putative membrane protein YesL [Amphibacillus cookii]